MNIVPLLFFVLIRVFSICPWPYYALLSISGYLTIIQRSISISIPSITTLLAPLIATHFRVHTPKNILETAILPAIVEEIAFRECIRPSWLAAILFGLMHIRPSMIITTTSLSTMIDIMLSCMLFHCWMMKIRPANILAHFWWNLIVLSVNDDNNTITTLNTIETSHSTMLLLLIMAFIG